jgi:formate-dependent nitrite reductase membrane component NrfD
MDLSSLVNETYKKPNTGTAHANPRDAYRDVPILKRPTWNHEVAAYFFFGGISAGAALIGSLAEVFGGDERKELARTAHYVSFATLLPCPPLLIDDLGRPERFHHMLRIVKPSSPMNLGSWALTAHGAGATITILAMLAREGKLPLFGWIFRWLPERLLAGLGLPSSFVLAGYTGVLLGTTSIPVWYTSPLLGALFMSSSISTGAAATHLVCLASGRDVEADTRALSAIGIASGATEAVLLGGYIATSGAAAKPLLKGESGALLLGAAMGLLLAAALEIASLRSRRHNPAISAVAGATTLAAGAMLRWAIVRAGRASADDREGTLDATKPRPGSPGWRP